MKQKTLYYFFTYLVKFLIYFACCAAIFFTNELMNVLIGCKVGNILQFAAFIVSARYFGRKWQSFRDENYSNASGK